MNLQPVGAINLTPATFFLWDLDERAVVEVTELESRYLIRCSKSYRIVKQSEEGRSWIQNITNLNDYLEQHFSHFQATVEFVDTVDPDATSVKREAEKLAAESGDLIQTREQLIEKIQDLKTSQSFGFEDFDNQLQIQIENLEEELHQVETGIDDRAQALEQKELELKEWERAGVMMAYLFSICTDPQVCQAEELDGIVRHHLDEIRRLHQEEVRQRLAQSKFQLQVEELEYPREFLRTEHSLLLNPESLSQLKESHPEHEEEFARLHEAAVTQFQAYATRDLNRQGSTFERRKAAPAQAIKAILEDLETEEVVQETVDVPNEGPMIGTLVGTEQTVGFDIFEHGPHYYLAGKTGTGKTHLKRVLIENAASKGYNVLTISPTKRDSLGINLSNTSHEHGTGLDFDQYWFGSEYLLNQPDDITELFEGVNAVSLYGYSDRQEFINTLLTTLDEIDLDDRELFVFLDESHRFNSGEAAEAIQRIAQEGRSHGIRLVLVSQDPKSFQYSYKEVRNNTSFILFNRNYEIDIQQLVSEPDRLSSLDRGVCVFADFLDLPEMTVEVRETLTRLWERIPSEEEIREVDQRFTSQETGLAQLAETIRNQSGDGNEPDFNDLDEEEQEVVDAVRQYIHEKDQRPSKNKVIETGPFGTSKTSRILDDLVEEGVIKQDQEERHGNQAQVFSII